MRVQTAEVGICNAHTQPFSFVKQSFADWHPDQIPQFPASSNGTKKNSSRASESLDHDAWHKTLLAHRVGLRKVVALSLKIGSP